jgi:Protein of unknown function (DUF3341)
MSHVETLNPIHGAMVEFDTPEELIEGCERAYAEGYRKMDAYAPLPVEGLAEAIGYKKNKVALCVLIGGLCGATFGFTFLEWISGVAYPHNVGGRPLNSWPSFIPITFECMILFAGLTSMFSMLAMNGLPKPYHPTFNVPAFKRASVDKFFLCIESTDPKFQAEDTLSFLGSLGGNEVSIVPA